MRIITLHNRRVKPSGQVLEFGFQHAAVREFKQTDTLFCTAGQHGAQRRFESGKVDDLLLPALGRRHPKHRLKRILKATF